jgi:hypothetical protein
MSGIFHIHQVNGIQVNENLSRDELIKFFDENLRIHEDPALDESCLGFRLLKDIHFPPYIFKDDEYRNIADNLIVIEYFWRKKSKKETFKVRNNEIHSNQISVLEDNRDYIFIIFPKLIIFKGAEEAYKAVWDDFFKIIRPIVHLNRNYAFKNEFYLKLLERLTLNNKILDTNFRINNILDLNLEGSKGVTEESVEIRKLYSISDSVVTLISLLIDHKIRSGNFDFCLKDFYFTMELKHAGEIIIKQQRGEFKNLPHNQRAFHGCYIIYRFLLFVDQWETLDEINKNMTPELRNKIKMYLEDNNIFPGIDD